MKKNLVITLTTLLLVIASITNIFAMIYTHTSNISYQIAMLPGDDQDIDLY